MYKKISHDEISVYDINNNVVALHSSAIIRETLIHDTYRCRGCGKEESLRIVQLINTIPNYPNERFPTALHATLCEDCRRRFQNLHFAGSHNDIEEEFEFLLRIEDMGTFHVAQDIGYIMTCQK